MRSRCQMVVAAPADRENRLRPRGFGPSSSPRPRQTEEASRLPDLRRELPRSGAPWRDGQSRCGCQGDRDAISVAKRHDRASDSHRWSNDLAPRRPIAAPATNGATATSSSERRQAASGCRHRAAPSTQFPRLRRSASAPPAAASTGRRGRPPAAGPAVSAATTGSGQQGRVCRHAGRARPAAAAVRRQLGSRRRRGVRRDQRRSEAQPVAGELGERDVSSLMPRTASWSSTPPAPIGLERVQPVDRQQRGEQCRHPQRAAAGAGERAAGPARPRTGTGSRPAGRRSGAAAAAPLVPAIRNSRQMSSAHERVLLERRRRPDGRHWCEAASTAPPRARWSPPLGCSRHWPRGRGRSRVRRAATAARRSPRPAPASRACADRSERIRTGTSARWARPRASSAGAGLAFVEACPEGESASPSGRRSSRAAASWAVPRSRALDRPRQRASRPAAMPEQARTCRRQFGPVTRPPPRDREVEPEQHPSTAKTGDAFPQPQQRRSLVLASASASIRCMSSSERPIWWPTSWTMTWVISSSRLTPVSTHSSSRAAMVDHRRQLARHPRCSARRSDQPGVEAGKVERILDLERVQHLVIGEIVDPQHHSVELWAELLRHRRDRGFGETLDFRRVRREGLTVLHRERHRAQLPTREGRGEAHRSRSARMHLPRSPAGRSSRCGTRSSRASPSPISARPSPS